MKHLVPFLAVLSVAIVGCGSSAIQTVTVHKPVAPVVRVARPATHHVTQPAIPRRAVVTPPAETHEVMCHRKFQESPPKSEQEAFVMYKEYGCNEAEALGMKPPSRAESERKRQEEQALLEKDEQNKRNIELEEDTCRSYGYHVEWYGGTMHCAIG